MKNKSFFLLILTLTLYSCKKDKANSSLTEDKGCIERISIAANSQGSFSNSEYSLTNSLFVNNGIYKSSYRYFKSYTDNTFRFVHTRQYTNSLPIFNKDLNYNFNNGVYGSFAGYLTSGTTLNTTPTLSLPQLRKLFIDNAEQFEHKGLQFKDSCLKAEFGYYDLNSGTGNIIENIIKGWKVTLKNSVEPFEYPLAYYQDNNGTLIYYDNGIRTFK